MKRPEKLEVGWFAFLSYEPAFAKLGFRKFAKLSHRNLIIILDFWLAIPGNFFSLFLSWNKGETS